MLRYFVVENFLKPYVMKTIINKYDLITGMLSDYYADFDRAMVDSEIRPEVAKMSDRELADQCNMVVLRAGFFVSK